MSPTDADRSASLPFVDMFRAHNGCTPQTEVTRIEFEYVWRHDESWDSGGLCGVDSLYRCDDILRQNWPRRRGHTIRESDGDCAHRGRQPRLTAEFCARHVSADAGDEGDDGRAVVGGPDLQDRSVAPVPLAAGQRDDGVSEHRGNLPRDVHRTDVPV